MLFGERAFHLLADGWTGKYLIHQGFDRRHERQLPGHRALQQKPRNNEPVDLVCSLENTIDAGIAIRPLRGVFLDEAVATVNLHGLVDNVIDHLRTPNLDDRTLYGVLFDCLPSFLCCFRTGFFYFTESGVHHSYCAIDERLAHINQRRHIGEFFPYQAEIGNNFVESLALFRVGDGIFQCYPRASHAHRAKLETPDVQDVECNHVSFADISEHILGGNIAVIQNNRARR